MLTFSNTHDWQGDPSVQQILVFACQETKDIFDKDFAVLVEKEGITRASDSNLGAIFKVRAVKNGKGLWDSVIRCGITGHMLHDQSCNATSSDGALRIGLMVLVARGGDDMLELATKLS